MNNYDREEDELSEAYNNGELTLKEYNFEMRELRRSYQAEAEEAAQRAYDDVMGNWG